MCNSASTNIEVKNYLSLHQTVCTYIKKSENRYPNQICKFQQVHRSISKICLTENDQNL